MKLQQSCAYFIVVFFLFAAFLLLPFLAPNAKAASLPYSQSFTSCSDRVIPGNDNPLDCTDVEKYGDAVCSLGGANLGATIMSTANYSGGGGGKGIRCYNGGDNDPDSGQFAINLDSNESEIWVRFYARFQTTWQYAGNSAEDFKILWVNDASHMNSGVIFGFKDDAYEVQNTVRFWNQDSTTEVIYGTANRGFQWLNGGNTGDGNWHLYEIHLRHETTTAPYNGIEEVKLDGVTVLSNTAVDFVSAYFTHFRFNVNTKVLAPSTCQYWDIDDIAVSNTGWIGAIDSDTTPPSAPSGLSVI